MEIGRCSKANNRVPGNDCPERPLVLLSLNFRRFVFNKRHLKSLARSKLLQPISKCKGLIHLIVLKDIQSPVQRYLPTVVRDDMAGVNGATFIKLPGEVDTHGASGFLDLFKALVLQVTLELISNGDEVNSHFILLRLVFHNRFEKFHEVADLVKKPDVGVCNGDLAGSPQVRAEQVVV